MPPILNQSSAVFKSILSATPHRITVCCCRNLSTTLSSALQFSPRPSRFSSFFLKHSQLQYVQNNSSDAPQDNETLSLSANRIEGEDQVDKTANLEGQDYEAGVIVWGASKHCRRCTEGDGLLDGSSLKHPMIVLDVHSDDLEVLYCSHSLPPLLCMSARPANDYTTHSEGHFEDVVCDGVSVPTKVALYPSLLIDKTKVRRNDPSLKPSIPSKLHKRDVDHLKTDSSQLPS